MQQQRWSVDELADTTGLSVDTIRFYQKRRLLPPPERDGRRALYRRIHVERIAQIRRLQDQGLTLAVIARILEGDSDVADSVLAVAIATEEGAPVAVEREELASRSGVPVEVIDLIAATGLLHPVDSSRFSAADTELVATGMQLVAAGLPLTQLVELASRHDKATREVAQRAVDMFAVHIRQPILDGPGSTTDKAERLLVAFDEMFPAVTSLVSRHFGRVLLELAREALSDVLPERARELTA